MQILSHFRVLKNPNYAKYFVGQWVSMNGTWMQSVAQSWLVYRLSHSAAYLGIITFCFQFPAFLLGPLAGWAADYFERKRILITVQILLMAQALAIAWLINTNQVQIWHLIVFAIFSGMANVFEMISRHAFAADLVEPKEMGNAITLNSFVINTSRITGPAVAGIILSAFGEAPCFWLNGLSFIPIIWGLLHIQTKRKQQKSGGNFTKNFGETIRYVRGNSNVLTLLGFAAIISLIGTPYLTILSALVKVELHGDAQLLALLMTLNGLGAVMGGLKGGREFSSQKKLIRYILLHLFLLGVTLSIFSISKIFILSGISICLCGFFFLGVYPAINTAIQNQIEDRIRGRVMSFYTMTFLGAAPLAGLIAGKAADLWGSRNVILISGVLCVLISFIFALRLTPESQK